MVFRGSWQPQYVQYDVGDVVEFQGSPTGPALVGYVNKMLMFQLRLCRSVF
jgi:hypothetical protein